GNEGGGGRAAGEGGERGGGGEEGGDGGGVFARPGGGAQGANPRRAAAPAEGRADVGTFAGLQQHDGDDGKAHQDVNDRQHDEHRITSRWRRRAPPSSRSTRIPAR